MSRVDGTITVMLDKKMDSDARHHCNILPADGETNIREPLRAGHLCSGLGLGNFCIFPIIQKNTKFKGSADGSPTQYPTQHQTHPNPPIEANDTDLHR